jgi:predicted small secreted protein
MFVFASTLALSSLAQAQILTTLPSKVIQPNEPADVRLTQEFGASVSTPWDNSLLVGAPGTDGHGAVYELRLTNGVWTQAARIVAPGVPPGRFGSQVVRANNDVLISDRARHLVYSFRLQNGTWRPRAILRGGTEGFGQDVRIQGCAAVISSTYDVDTGPPPTQPGYVHIYNRCLTNDGSWAYVQSLTPPGSKPGDHFGASVAFSGNTLMVGAPGEDNGYGGVYWYEYENHKLGLKQRLTGPYGRAYSFGSAVVTDGYMVVVGSPKMSDVGVANTFFPGWDFSTNFSWAAEVSPAGDVLADGRFGSRIALTPERVFISAPGYSSRFHNAGHVSVYKRYIDPVHQSLAPEVDLTTGNSMDGFGADISAIGRTLVVGEPGYRTRPDSSEGRVLVYQLPASP